MMLRRLAANLLFVRACMHWLQVRGSVASHPVPSQVQHVCCKDKLLLTCLHLRAASSPKQPLRANLLSRQAAPVTASEGDHDVQAQRSRLLHELSWDGSSHLSKLALVHFWCSVVSCVTSYVSLAMQVFASFQALLSTVRCTVYPGHRAGQL